MFVGFVSTGDIKKLSLYTGYHGDYRFPVVSALTLGVASVPEPGPGTLLLSGLGLLLARRQRLRR